MPSITPHLWFDREAVEAASFYADLFPDSSVDHVGRITDTPSGDCDVVSFTVVRQPFAAISAGPMFRFNPSISFMVALPSRDQVDHTWGALMDGGQALMPLDEYPFSPHFGWVQDRFGLSWQVMWAEGAPSTTLTPMLLFTGDVAGRAEEAMTFYTGLFDDSRIDAVMRHPEDAGPESAGSVLFGSFTLGGQPFAAMDSADAHAFSFGEAISFMVRCDTQEQIDHYWNALSAVPEAERCGWLKDRFGVSWQIVPTVMDRMMASGDESAIHRVTEAFLAMKKFDIAALEQAFQSA